MSAWIAARLLLVEDDEAIASGLARVLDGQGYAVRRLARGGRRVRAAEPPVGLVILDLGLPDIDGIEVCRRLRAARPDLAILILTARDQELDVVAGLDAGADDYLVKPFRLSELLARVRAHLRAAAAADARAEPEPLGGRPASSTAPRAAPGGAARSSRCGPRSSTCSRCWSPTPAARVTRERIMREVWDTDWLGSTKTLDTHVLDPAPEARRRRDHDAARRRLPLRGAMRRRLVLAIARSSPATAVLLFAMPLGDRRCSAPTATRSCCACSATRSPPRASIDAGAAPRPDPSCRSFAGRLASTTGRRRLAGRGPARGRRGRARRRSHRAAAADHARPGGSSSRSRCSAASGSSAPCCGERSPAAVAAARTTRGCWLARSPPR